MQQGLIQAVLVGADRIAANGDVISKIGTYSLALLARAHNLAFLVAAPLSTIDVSLGSGQAAPLVQHDPEEIYRLGSTVTCPHGAAFYNPASDVTPAALITAIVTEGGAVAPHSLQDLCSP
jgi:methylthioribose-1-phosphate isomerase